ncbi:hypothetical protein GPJ56_008507 [Histomonas meleagridis]|uniref:uncharacterized protein n=1 Tax=Histomonas meleagridis TaxID=135588 RepID=UPI00355A2BA5|nr:hypothetical protein GPJ56_008507 [Histomonas meleagridis]KAH0798353.1 hypothetical protein GO595_008902 [Histomonas meleagridis]
MCCLATIVDENNIKQALVLGHSLSQVSPKIPKIIALQTSQIPSDKKEQLSKYFEIHEVINQTQNLSHQELIYWELEEYYPVIAVRANGVFNSSPYKLCSAPPFSAVSNRGDAIFFDTSFMVLDPKQKLQQDKSTKKFYDLANGQIIDWNPLRTDSSVEDYSNEYIDFWLRYSTPIYIHYADDVFSNALSGSGQTTGSKGLYKIILEIVQKAKRDLGDTLL